MSNDADSTSIDTATTGTRRGLLRLAAAATAGAVASTVGQTGGASAADGDAVTLGQTKTGTGFTRADHTGTTAGAAFLFQAGDDFGSTDGRFKAALNGWTTTTAIPVGVYGWSNVASGAGVVGRAIGTGSAGVVAESDVIQGAALRAETSAFGGVAVRANGSGNDGIGVRASGQVGVWATGTQTGVYTEDCPVGVYGSGSEAGLMGWSPVAPLHLMPLGIAAPDSGVAHSRGQFVVDEAGDLWYCVTDGTPGTWRKLAGEQTAGAFHALTATRVFDSRSPAPRRGRLRNGANRLVSVADGRNLSTGAVTVADLVPPRASAVTLSVSVLDTRGAGTLTVNPGGTTAVTGTTVSWWGSGQAATASTVVPLDAQRRITLCVRGTSRARAHVTVDVTGYHL